MASNLLSDVAVRKAKVTDKPRKLSDGGGLNLLLHPNGSKYFQFRYTLHGKEKTSQLGTYPDMTLSDARQAAKTARNLVAAGLDPVQEKRKNAESQAIEASSTFKSVVIGLPSTVRDGAVLRNRSNRPISAPPTFMTGLITLPHSP